MPEPGRLSEPFATLTSQVAAPDPQNAFDAQLTFALSNAISDLQITIAGLQQLAALYRATPNVNESSTQVAQDNYDDALLSYTVLLDVVRVFAGDAARMVRRGNVAGSYAGQSGFDEKSRRLKNDLDAARERPSSRFAGRKRRRARVVPPFLSTPPAMRFPHLRLCLTTRKPTWLRLRQKLRRVRTALATVSPAPSR